jgi:hypothetical protein
VAGQCELAIKEQENKQLDRALRPPTALASYSGFDSAFYRNVDSKWHFPQENATSHDPQMATRESKPL